MGVYTSYATPEAVGCARNPYIGEPCQCLPKKVNNIPDANKLNNGDNQQAGSVKVGMILSKSGER